MPFVNILVLISLGLTIAQAAPKSKPTKADSAPHRVVMDTTLIHHQYVEGDFEEAIDKLETALKYVSPLSHEDSVFIFKHLGVMYTAKYETREKGKQFMMRLLDVEPTARLMDMYASDMIYMIFKNIQDEYEMSKSKLKRAQDRKDDNLQKEAADAHQNEKPDKMPSYKWIPWTVAAVAAAGGVVYAVTVFNEEEPGRKENVIQWNP